MGMSNISAICCSSLKQNFCSMNHTVVDTPAAMRCLSLLLLVTNCICDPVCWDVLIATGTCEGMSRLGGHTLELKACSLHWIYFSNDDAVEKHEVAITFPLRKILSLVLVPINI